MPKQTLRQAHALLLREATKSAQAPFDRKSNPIEFESDGPSLIEQIAAHPVFRSILICFFDNSKVVKIGTEIRCVHDMSSLSGPTPIGLIFDLPRDEAIVSTFHGSAYKADSPWNGPNLSELFQTNNFEDFKALIEDKDNHNVVRKSSPCIAYLPRKFFDLLQTDLSLTEDLDRLGFKIVKLCKEKNISVYKNGKFKKNINPNITSFLDLIIHGLTHEPISVDISTTEDKLYDLYASTLGETLDQPRSPSQSSEDDESTVVTSNPLATTEQFQDQTETIPSEDESEVQQPPDSPKEMPFFNRRTKHSSLLENSSSNSDQSDSDDDIPEPKQKKKRPLSRLLSQDLKELRALAKSYAESSSDEEEEELQTYGSKRNKLNKLSFFKIQAFLNACSSDCKKPAETLPKTLISMMENQNGAELASYIEGTLCNFNISVCIGFCTAILSGILCN